MKSKSVYRNIIFFFLISMLCFTAVTIFLNSVIKKHLDTSVNSFITDNFADDVRYYLLRGNHAEVYKKCKKLSQKEFIDSVSVLDASGETICAFGPQSDKLDAHNKKLYYDSQEEGLLSTVQVNFNSNLHTIVLLATTFSIFAFFSITLLIGLYAFKRSLVFITLPFEKFINRIGVLGIDSEGVTYFKDLKRYKESNHIYDLISRLVTSTLRQQEKVLKDNKSNVTYEISRQVLHDIRSPLTTLKKLSQNDNVDKEVLAFAISRIEQISNDLSSNINPANLCFVHLIILKIIQEKKIEYQEKKLEFSYDFPLKDVFKTTNLSEIEFSRILSNLLNNSIEACQNDVCKIAIKLNVDVQGISLTIDDNGPGIPEERREQVFFTGVSSKVHGSGLGLHHCMTTVKKGQGSVELADSPLGGLRVCMRLKKSFIPDEVFATNVPDTEVVHIIDDESDLYLRLKKIPNLTIKHYQSPEEARASLGEFKNDVVFVDFNFTNSSENGLTLIKDITSQNKFLVTNDFDDLPLTQKVLEAKIKIIPKPYLEYVNSSLFRPKSN